MNYFTAWSFSRLELWEECPLRAKLRHIDKVPEPPAPALVRGSAIHTLAEEYSLGKLKKLPDELKLFKLEFKNLLSLSKKLQVEQQLGLDENWQPTDWFGPKCWCRIVMDCMYDLEKVRCVIDYKTGRVNQEKHRAQLSLYAIGAFATAPKSTTEVSTQLWYLDHGQSVCVLFKKSKLAKLKGEWERRAEPMLKDRIFNPNPGDACRWCPYAKKRGGPCKV